MKESIEAATGCKIDSDLLPYYVRGLVNRDSMEVRHPYNFPIESISRDFNENNISFGTFTFLKNYIDLIEKKQKVVYNEEKRGEEEEGLDELDIDEILDAIDESSMIH